MILNTENGIGFLLGRPSTVKVVVYCLFYGVAVHIASNERGLLILMTLTDM